MRYFGKHGRIKHAQDAKIKLAKKRHKDIRTNFNWKIHQNWVESSRLSKTEVCITNLAS
jgi:hypothetical protein